MDFEVKNTEKHGLGLYTNYSYVPGEVILKFEGTKLSKQSIPNFSGSVAACLLQIDKEMYLDLGKRNEFFINHSCNPNTGVKIVLGQAFLVAIYPIAAGEQLFFDYSTTSTEQEDTWTMECKCGNYSCRKNITGFHSLSEDRKKFFMDKKIVPGYIK